MTEAEALDMAAKAAGWRDWKTLQLIARPDKQDDIRRHARTLMENAENARLLSMSAEREINLRGELLRLQRKNAALKAENERLQGTLRLFQAMLDDPAYDYGELLEEYSAAVGVALKEIDRD